MAYAIYFLKMELISERFQMSAQETRNVHQMAIIISLFHAPFLQSRLASIPPAIDFKYISQTMSSYKKKDEKVAIVAMKSISNHLWYLTEELVKLSVFDETLPNALRQGMVKKLLTFSRPKIIPPSKPK